MHPARRVLSRSISLLFLLAFPIAATAATAEFHVILDTDNNALTGCRAVFGADGVAGAEQILTTSIEVTADGANVTGVSLRRCSGAAFGAPVEIDKKGWPVGIDEGGISHVETHIPLSVLGGAIPAMQRLTFLGTTATVNSVLLSGLSGSPATTVPPGRRRAVAPTVGELRAIVLDGQTDDWKGLSAFAASGSVQSSVIGLQAVYVSAGSEDLFFLFQARLTFLAPFAADDTFQGRQGAPLSVPPPGVLANDISPTNAPLSTVMVAPPQHGTVSLSTDGGFGYSGDVATGANQFDQFTYKVTDGKSESNNATVTINLADNSAPVAGDDSYSVSHGGTLTVDQPGLLANDKDADNDRLTAAVETKPQHGTLTLSSSGAFTYTHDGSDTASDSFRYRVADGITSTIATVSITIGANAAPIANDDAYTTTEGAILDIPAPGLFANDSDPDSPRSIWTAEVLIPPLHGTVTLGTAGAFKYVHNGSETTSDIFWYRLKDGILYSAPAKVTITVVPVNDPPVANEDIFTTVEDAPLNVPAAGVLANDTDSDIPPQTLTASLVTAPIHGTVALNANGSFSYTPQPNFGGTDGFSYNVTDGIATAVGKVTVNVVGVNDAPTFTGGGNVTVLEDTPFSQPWATNISAGPPDESGQTLTFLVVNNTNPGLFGSGPAISPAGVLSFTPALNANGSADITVVLKDNGGTAGGGVDTSAPVTFTINVTPVNDAPSFTVAGDPPAVNEDSGPQTVPGFATNISAGPPNEAGQTLAFIVLSNSNPSLFAGPPVINPNGDLFYVPAPEAFGTATITVVLRDNGGTANGGNDTSLPVTFTITVNPVNDAPSFLSGGNVTVPEDTVYAQLWATNISAGPPNESGQTLTFNIVSNSNPALFSVQPSISATGVLTFTPAAEASGSADLTVVLQDNGGTANGGIDTSLPAPFTITVNAVNDPPVNTVPASATANEDTSVDLAAIAPGISVFDVDAGFAPISVTFNASTGIVTIGSTAGLGVTGNGTSNLNLVGPQSAINTALASGLTYTPPPNFNGPASVAMITNDLGNSGPGGPQVDVDVIPISIVAVNDAPVNTVPPAQSVDQDTVLTLAGANAISIADVDSTTALITLTATNGTMTLSSTSGLSFTSGDGTADATMVFTGAISSINTALNGMTYTPATGYFGPAMITIVTNDQGNTGSGGPQQDSDTVVITVIQVNQAPVNIVPGPQTTDEDTTLVFSSANGNTIATSDPDAGSGTVLITLGVLHGNLHLVPTAGVTINNNDTGNVTATGTITNLNTALSGMTYAPLLNYNGSDTLTFTTDDQGNTGPGGPKSDTDTVAITVTAVNDPPTDILLSNSSIAENQPAGTTVGTLSDVDADTGDTAAFALVAGAGSTDNASFTIVANQLRTAASFDFETKSSYAIRIGVTDSGSATFEKQFTITVTNVNEAPVINDQARSINENSANGSAVGAPLVFTDPDTGQTFTFAITGGNTGGTFAISNAGQITVANNTALNFEVNPTFSLTVQVTDSGTPALSDTAVVTIMVNDVNEAPTAGDETYANVIGNTTQRFGDGGGTMTSNVFHTTAGDVNPKANDTDPDTNPAFNVLTVVPVDNVATNFGGKISIDADGTFSYTPPPGFTGTDFYDYTITDGTNTDVGRMTFTISNLVWYVKNDDTTAPFLGTSSDPFNTLAAAGTAVSTPAGVANTIFVFKGDGTNTGMNAGIALDPNQNLIGAAASLVVGAETLITGAPANRPVIGNSGGDGVSIAASVSTTNAIKGLSIAGAGGAGNGIDLTTTAGTIGLTIDDVIVTGSTAEGIDINAGGGTVTVNLSNLDVTAGTTGIDINRTLGTASVATFSGITVRGATGGSGIVTNNVGFSSISAGTVVVGSAGDHIGSAGIVLNTVSGAITFTNLQVFADGPLGALVAGGSPTFGLTVSNPPTLLAAAGPVLNLSAVNLSMSNAVLTSNNSPANGISLANVTGTLSTTSGSALSNAGAADVNISGGNADVTYNGTITDDLGQLVSVGSTTGGTKIFAGAITDNDNGTGNGVSLTSNTNATIRFNGGLVLSTGSNAAFVATGGGTVEVCDESACSSAAAGSLINKITTGTGTPLNVSATTIGAGGLEFRSISSNGAANGISLNNTGTTGGLKVRGTGTGGSGGTIQSSTGAGVLLMTTANVSLSSMNIQNGGDDGIHGESVTNLDLIGCAINTNGNSTSDDGIQLGLESGSTVGVTGTLNITNTAVNSSAHNGVHLRNTSGTLSAMNVTGSTFNNLNDTFGANAFLFEMSGTSVTTAATMNANTFDNNSPQRALEVQTHDTGRIGGSGQYFVVSGSTFTNNGIHASFTQDTNSNLAFKFINNGTSATRMTGSTLQAINVFSSSQATGGTIVGVISGNFVGSTSAGAISAVIQGQTDATLLIDGNSIIQTNGDSRAIGVAFRGPANPLAGTLGPNTVISDLTITNNSVTPGPAPSGFPLGTIVVEADNQSGADNKAPTVRADIRNNVVPTTPVFDFLDAHIIFYEYDAAGGHGIGELFDSPPASADATAQLTSTNTGTVGAFGVALTTTPVNTPP